MPYEIAWYIEKRVIRVRQYGDMTIEEMVRCGDDTTAYAEKGIKPLFLLIDTREITKFPLNFRDMLQGMGQYSSTPLVSWTITLSNNSLMRFFGVMASKVVRVPMKTVATMQEADTFIAHLAPDLAPILAARKSE